jgi:hypothetical protein
MIRDGFLESGDRLVLQRYGRNISVCENLVRRASNEYRSGTYAVRVEEMVVQGMRMSPRAKWLTVSVEALLLSC